LFGNLYVCPIYSTSGTQKLYRGEWFMVMVLNATFNHVSVIWCLPPLLKIFRFFGGGNRSIRENYRLVASPLQMLYWEHLAWAGFELTTVMGIGTDCMVSCKSNYHSITTTPKLCNTVYNIHVKKLENKSLIFDCLLLSPCSNVFLFLAHNAMFLTEFHCTKKKHGVSSWWMDNHQDRRFDI